jgi:hypothetical protein
MKNKDASFFTTNILLPLIISNNIKRISKKSQICKVPDSNKYKGFKAVYKMIMNGINIITTEGDDCLKKNPFILTADGGVYCAGQK